tara:strand:- start:498 stop:1856 length:1359 start_codon:yes stop_codon:yes gene_type:complete
MKKNVVVIPYVKSKSFEEKYGDWKWMDIAIMTWEYWCKKNDCILYIYDKPKYSDLKKHRITWQRWFDVFDCLEAENIDYDKIYMVDANTMVRWDTPNFFEFFDDEWGCWRDTDNLRWIKEGIDGYKPFFNDFELNTQQYHNAGLVVFNKSHKEFLKSFEKLYHDNYDFFEEAQTKTIKKGTDQCPLNYWLAINKVKTKTDVPISFKLTHIHRKEMFNHNWQLNEDQTPFFIKYAYIWMFNGMPKDQRTSLMSQTWEIIKHNYTFNDDELLLNSVRHKDTFKNATSRKFKKDLIEYFKDDKYREMTAVELGCCQGDTTKILSSLFKSVYAYDHSIENVNITKNKCDENVECHVMDVTNDEWKFPKADVVFIDASHDYPQVAIDIQKAVDYFDNPIIILDDYGNPNNTNIRNSIDLKVNEGIIKVDTHIGEEQGFKTKSGWIMNDREGVICNVC